VCSSAADSAFRLFNKGQHIIDFRATGNIRFDAGNGIRQLQAGHEERLVGFFQLVDRIRGESATFEADQVKTAQLGVAPPCGGCYRKGEDIQGGHRAAANHGIHPDGDELVNGNKTSQNNVVLDGDMAGQGGYIGHDHAVADAAVMSHMRIGHEHVAVADDRFGVTGNGASMDGGKFAKHVVVADPRPALFTPVLEILWRRADRRLREYLVVFTDFSPVSDDGMSADSGPLADRNMFADNGVWAHFYIRSQVGGTIDYCCRVDHDVSPV